MDLQISNRVALVTGASQGIGYAIAKGLAAEGVKVVVSSRDEAKLAAAAEQIGAAAAIPADVSDPDQLQQLLDSCREKVGDPDILVVNGGGPPPGLAAELDDEAWARGYDLTLMSAVRLARACLPAMRSQHWGRIICVTSMSVKEPIANLTLSNAFRAGVTGFVRTLATEVAADGVTVNNVAPGATDTQRIRQLNPTPEALAAVAQRIPAKRIATADEVASAAVYLTGVPAAMITGQTILVDGGSVGSLL
ncbi:MAG: 3-oxoacyl-[acyl-carrier protein] reductase [Verrucomicrobiales bacterium]|jgi:3-oxoacyl-[acyl-carrier protein] reductase